MDIRQFLQDNKVNNKKSGETINNQVASNNNIVTPKKMSIREFLDENKLKPEEKKKEKDYAKIKKQMEFAGKAQDLGKDIVDTAKNVGKGAYSNIQRYNAFLGERTADVLDFLTPMGDNIVSPYFRESAEKSKQWLKDYNAEQGGTVAKIAGEVLGDPLVYILPSGIVSQGTKLARVGKSALAGAGVGSGMQYIRNEAEDRPQDESLAVAGGIGAGVNAIISGITRGKINSSDKLKSEISKFLKKEEVVKVQTAREQQLIKELQEFNKLDNPTPQEFNNILARYRGETPTNITDDVIETAGTRAGRKADNIPLSQQADNIPTSTMADDVANITHRVSNDIDIATSTDEQIANAVTKQIQQLNARRQGNITGNTPFDDYVTNSTDDEIKSLYGTTKDDLLNLRQKLAKGEEITQSERNTLNKVYKNAMANQEVNTSALKSYVDTVESIPQVQAVTNTMEEVANIDNANKVTQAISNINPVANAKANISKSLLMSGIGGTAGAGSEIASAIYNDREINTSDLLGRSLVGALLGYGASKGRAGLNIQNVGEQATQQATQQVPKRTFKEIINKLKENTLIDYALNTKIWKHTDYLDDRKSMYMALDKGSQYNAEIFRALSKLSVEAKKELHEYLVGDIKTANASIMKLADEIRTTVNQQGQKAVDLGLLSQEAFDEWKDIYLFRKYETNLLQGIKQRLNKSLSINPVEPRGKIWKGTKDELAQYEADDMIGRLAEGKISYRVERDGSITFRRDWTKEERVSMGEVVDGAVTVTNTLQNLNKLITMGKFLQDTNGMYGTVSAEKIAGYTQLNGAKWGALNGKYVPDEIANDLKGISVQVLGYDNPFREMWQQYLRGFKRSKTVYNPKSHVNNVIGNASLLMLEGYPVTSAVSFIMRDSMALNGLEKLKELKALAKIGQIDEAGQRKLQKLMQDKSIQKAIEADSYGLFEGGRLDELLMNYADPSTTGGWTEKLAKKIKIDPLLKKMQKAYQVEDNSARLSMYRHLTEKQGMTPEEAIKEIRRLVPDYRQPMARLFQGLRDTGFMPFISWTYYTLPAVLKQLNIFGTSKAGAGLNKYRAYNITKVIGAVALLDMMLTPDVHIWSEQPKGFQGKRFPVSVDSNGNVTGIKIDRWLQQSSFFSPGEFLRSNFMSGIPQKVIGNIGFGRDPYFQNKITYNEGLRKAYDIGEYAVKGYVPAPQFMYDTYDLAKSYLIDEETRRTQRVTNPRSRVEQALTFFGLNVLSYDMDEFERQQQEETLREIKKARKEAAEKARGR